MHQSKIEQAREKVEDLKRELTEEVTSEVRSNLKKREWRRAILRCGGCCSLSLLALLALILLALSLVARTGLVPVPVFGERVRHERPPIRVVPATVGDLQELLASKVRAAMTGTTVPDRIAITFTESELTGLLRATVAASGMPERLRRTVQVAVDRDVAEFHARYPGFGGAETTIRARGRPAVVDGRLDLDLTEVAVGNLGLPSSLASRIVQSYLGGFERIEVSGRGATPSLVAERIELRAGAAAITFRVASKGP